MVWQKHNIRSTDKDVGQALPYHLSAARFADRHEQQTAFSRALLKSAQFWSLAHCAMSRTLRLL